jgi:hypothetical protein
MKIKSIFDPQRFALLVRAEIKQYSRTIFIGIGIAAAIYFVSTIPPILFHPHRIDSDFHQGFYPAMLFIAGCLLSAGVFAEIHKPNRNANFFLLPASLFEKMLVRLLGSGIGFALISTLVYYLFTLISSGIAAIYDGGRFPVFNPFTRGVLLTIAVYLVTHAIFLFGSVYFKKHSFMKTGISLFALVVLLSIFAGIVFRIVYGDYFQGMNFMDNGIFTEFDGMNDFGITLAAIFKYIFWIALAPLCWILTYLRLSETEV